MKQRAKLQTLFQRNYVFVNIISLGTCSDERTFELDSIACNSSPANFDLRQLKLERVPQNLPTFALLQFDKKKGSLLCFRAQNPVNRNNMLNLIDGS